MTSHLIETDPVVHVRGLYKRYGGRTVVDGLDLDVHAGEVVGLVGANGAGKTTSVECIQGLRRPDGGTIRVFGLDPLAHAGTVRTLVGSQLQRSELPDRLRVGEAVDLFANPGVSAGGALLTRFGLSQKRRCAFGALSGGERQRLFLVLALLNAPRLLILDELTQGLDPAARREVLDAITELRRTGTTVLLVTHELDEAEVLCDRVVAMRDGTVVDEGTPRELIDRHAPWATVRFTAPGDLHVIEALAALPGVRHIDRDGASVTILGDRRSVAFVGQALVAQDTIPADLAVRTPSLDDALITLLRAEPAVPVTAAPDLVGAR
jgi:ABC-2 type transport system ATP-binding protein